MEAKSDDTLKSRAAKGFLWGGLNNGMVQLLSALFGIVLLRLLSPDDYGRYAKLLVFANIASTLQESGFTAALCNLPHPTHHDYNAVFWCNVGIGGFLYCLLFLCAPAIAGFYGDPTLISLSRYLFLGFFISSLGTAQRAYLFIHLMNRESCIIAITSVILSNAVGVTMALLGFAYWALATQNILFILVVAVMNWYYSPWHPTLNIHLQPAIRMFGFGSKLMLTNIINRLSSNAFDFLLGKFYGNHLTGIYSNARKWNDMGANTITGMLTGVAQPILSGLHDDVARCRAAFRKMMRFVSFVSFPCLLGIGLIAPEFIHIVAGDKWAKSAGYLSLLCLYGAVSPLQALYGQLIISRGQSNINMWSTISLSTLVLAGLVFLYPHGLTAMVTYFVALNIAWLLVWQYFAHRLIHLSLWEALSDMVPFFVVSLLVMSLTWWLTHSIVNVYLLLAAKMLLAISLYTGLMWLSGAKVMQESIQFIRTRKI